MSRPEWEVVEPLRETTDGQWIYLTVAFFDAGESEPFLVEHFRWTHASLPIRAERPDVDEYGRVLVAGKRVFPNDENLPQARRVSMLRSAADVADLVSETVEGWIERVLMKPTRPTGDWRSLQAVGALRPPIHHRLAEASAHLEQRRHSEPLSVVRARQTERERDALRPKRGARR